MVKHCGSIQVAVLMICLIGCACDDVAQSAEELKAFKSELADLQSENDEMKTKIVEMEAAYAKLVSAIMV